jgi:hypothetical protein
MQMIGIAPPNQNLVYYRTIAERSNRGLMDIVSHSTASKSPRGVG